MSQSMKRFSEWVFRSGEGVVSDVRLLKATSARHKGEGAHPRVMAQRAGRKAGVSVLVVRIPDDRGYLTYEVVTSNPAETAARITSGVWL